MSREAKPFEAALTILIAVSAALVGVAGYLSAETHTAEDRARARGLVELNEANTEYLDATQTINLDWQLSLQAELASYEGKEDQARYLRSQMYIVQLGYLDEDGNPASNYADLNDAWNAYLDYMYKPSDDSRSASEEAFTQAENAAQKGLDYLFSTVVLAITAMLGTVAMSAQARRLRLALLFLGGFFLAGATGLILLTTIT